VNPFQDPSRPSPSEPGSRRDDYVQWRRRLADKQDELRSVGEPAPARVLDPQWSPEALFQPHVESAPPAEGDRADDAPEVAVAPHAAEVPAEQPTTSGTPDRIDLVAGATHPPRVEPAEKRRELEGLLRRFRATARSPRTIAAAGPPPSSPGFMDGRSSVRRRAPVTQEGDARGERSVDVHPGVPSTVGRAPTATVSEQLRALNQLRVDGELSDEEFKLRKHDLFLRSSNRSRPST